MTSPLLLRLNDGRKHKIATGTCDSCTCEFFFPDHKDFYPRFCPYCGIQYLAVTTDDGPHIPFKDTKDETN